VRFCKPRECSSLTRIQLGTFRATSARLSAQRALESPYIALIAAAALISVAGAIVPYYSRLLFEAAAALAIVTGASAVVGLAWGCVLMVRETRLAVQNLAEEAKVQVARHAPVQPIHGSSPQAK
jgi:hypothetical protein